ncbi:hypothetical protein KR038_007777, partial [Drosophila bunnanda]
MSKSVLRLLLFQVQPLILRRLCQETPKLSNTERPPKDPPDEGYGPTSVDHDGIDVPDFVNPAAFRQFSGPDEQLGPGAGKAEKYKNGHYFAYHRFSFQELQTQTIELRGDKLLDGGLQATIEADEGAEVQEKQLATMKKLEEECDKILADQAKDIEVAKKAAKEKAAKEKLEQEKLKKEKMEKEKLEKENKPKEEMKLGKMKQLEEMTEEELEEWCLKQEAAIKEMEKTKGVKEEVKPKDENKGKEKTGKSLKKEAAIKEMEILKEVKKEEKPKEENKGKEKTGNSMKKE